MSSGERKPDRGSGAAGSETGTDFCGAGPAQEKAPRTSTARVSLMSLILTPNSPGEKETFPPPPKKNGPRRAAGALCVVRGMNRNNDDDLVRRARAASVREAFRQLGALLEDDP